MKEIHVDEVRKVISELFGKIAFVYPAGILQAIGEASRTEEKERAVNVLKLLMSNAEIAAREHVPVCQDTGMAFVWLKVGQDVHFTGGSLTEAVNAGVAEGYTGSYLRASVVSDPLFDRKNTGNNTPAVIHTEIVEGDTVSVEVMAKGFGSENKSQLKMLTPAQGVEGVREFVEEAVRKAGPDACPPYIVGVGIGGSAETAAALSKRALLRDIDVSNPDERYRKLEDELLEQINRTGIGPMGYGGKTTALKVQVEYAPTHIAGLPVAVNICCHICRHAKAVIA